jgi:hypothetical protein
MRLCPFLFLNQLKDAHEIWYGRYIIGDHLNLLSVVHHQ